MGTKGDKKTGAADEAAIRIVDSIEAIPGITSKKMFGGYGIFHDGVMFGIIDSQGIAFLKINEEIKPDFESKDSVQHSRMPYYSIPDSILTNKEALVDWANRSIEITK